MIASGIQRSVALILIFYAALCLGGHCDDLEYADLRMSPAVSSTSNLCLHDAEACFCCSTHATPRAAAQTLAPATVATPAAQESIEQRPLLHVPSIDHPPR